MKLFPTSLLFATLLVSAASVRAQELFGVQEQIDALKEEMIVLQRKIYRDSVDAPIQNISSGQAEVKLGEYDEIIRTMNGKIDEMEHRIKQLEGKIDSLNHDFDVRFKLLEGKPIPAAEGGFVQQKKFDAAVANGAPKAIVGEAISTGSLTNLQPEKLSVNELYTQGLEALKAGNSAEAEQKFGIILNRHPEDSLAGNAQYWLGEVYYKDKNYAKAAVAFGKGYENYKNGSKGADCLLKLGLSMMQIGKKEEACLAFVNLPQEFPKADSAVKSKADEEAKRNNCR